MDDEAFWALIEGHARAAWRGEDQFPLRAYSELMPAQFVGWKPCARGRGTSVATLGAREIDEYEWVHELVPGFDKGNDLDRGLSPAARRTDRRCRRDRAGRARGAGGRFGYRMYFPPMRAGLHELFWHVPLIAKHGERFPGTPAGVLTAERAGAAPIHLVPERLVRPAHVAAAALEPVRGRPTPSHNARKLLDARAWLGEPLDPSFARSLLRLPRHASLDDYLLHAIPEVRRCVGFSG